MYFISFIVADFFFFKQKSAYEMRISDWSSDVCSSDLQVGQVSAVFRRDDEPELVAIVLAAIKEGLRLGAVLGRRIELPTLAIARRAVALDVAQMGGGFTVLSGQIGRAHV